MVISPTQPRSAGSCQPAACAVAASAPGADAARWRSDRSQEEPPLRVTGGRLRGRRLRSPGATPVRPTSDRVREALFARLGALAGARVLDLYAGTGALGVEALSRGAAAAVFVERAAAALAALRSNLEALGLAEAGWVLRGDVPAVVRRLGRAQERFDLVFVDPPYGSGEAGQALRALVMSGILRDGATVVLETSWRDAVPEVRGLAVLDTRRYGDTRIMRLAPASCPSREGGSVQQ